MHTFLGNTNIAIIEELLVLHFPITWFTLLRNATTEFTTIVAVWFVELQVPHQVVRDTQRSARKSCLHVP